MSESYWDNSPEVDVYEDMESVDTYIRVNGSNIEVDPGSSFIDVVKSTAQNAGLGKFRVFLNGVEIRPSEAPEVIAEGDHVELRPYDVAG